VKDDVSKKKKTNNSKNKTKQETIYQAMVKTMDNDTEWLCVVSEHGRMPVKPPGKRLDGGKKKQKETKIDYEFDR
jgi:hypothetical protein